MYGRDECLGEEVGEKAPGKGGAVKTQSSYGYVSSSQMVGWDMQLPTPD